MKINTALDLKKYLCKLPDETLVEITVYIDRLSKIFSIYKNKQPLHAKFVDSNLDGAVDALIIEVGTD